MILIPVKDRQNAKQRLSPLLTPDERRAIAHAMLEDVLEAVAAVPDRPPVSLVTGDPGARALAGAYGFAVIEDLENGGETAAIEMATEVCVRVGADGTLVIPGDAPLVTAAEITEVLHSAPEQGSVLVTDYKHRGSNAVLRRPANLFPLRFGDDSYAPHLQSAQRSGFPVVQLHLSGIALDIDRPEDVALLLARDGQTRTQKLLREWNADERLRALAVVP